MVKTWTIISLLGFLWIAIFGLVLMPYDGSAHDVNCLASLVNGVASPCPQNDPLGFASFHNNALQKISSLTIIDGATALYVIFALGLVLFGFLLIKSAQQDFLKLAVTSQNLRATGYHVQTERLNWFSLHENSPSLF